MCSIVLKKLQFLDPSEQHDALNPDMHNNTDNKCSVVKCCPTQITLLNNHKRKMMEEINNISNLLAFHEKKKKKLQN